LLAFINPLLSQRPICCTFQAPVVVQGSYLLYPDGIYKEVGERVNHLLCKYDEFRSMGLDDELFQRLSSEQLRHEDRVGQLVTALEGSWQIKKDMNGSLRVYILPESAKRLDADYKVSRQSLHSLCLLKGLGRILSPSALVILSHASR
jgi:hypothetical protein